MGRRSIHGGVLVAGQYRIQLDLTIDGVRYRPTLPWIPTEANLRRARAYLEAIKTRIAANTFHFDEAFPDYCRRRLRHLPLRTRTCSHIFDAHLEHEQARVDVGDLAAATLTAHQFAFLSSFDTNIQVQLKRPGSAHCPPAINPALNYMKLKHGGGTISE